MKVRLVDRLVYVAARLAIAVAAFVPQWLGYGFARALGRAYFACDGRRRGYALRYLRNAFPELDDRARLAIAAKATANLFCVPLDMARLTRLLAKGGSVAEVVDFGPAAAMLGHPAPFLALTAHIGNWEVAAVAMAQQWRPAHVVARVSKNPLLQRWIHGNRLAGGLVIHPRRGGIRGLARAVAGGAIGLQAVDQNQRLRGVFAPFFGERASCERAAVSLALRHDLPITIGAGLRRGRGFQFELVLSPPFRLERTGDKAADLLAAVTRVNRELEGLIRRAPEQYLWIHDRYRTQPTAAVPAAGGADDADAAGDDE